MASSSTEKRAVRFRTRPLDRKIELAQSRKDLAEIVDNTVARLNVQAMDEFSDASRQLNAVIRAQRLEQDQKEWLEIAAADRAAQDVGIAELRSVYGEEVVVVPGYNDARLSNAAMIREDQARLGGLSSSIVDLDRSVGMFDKRSEHATITIQAYGGTSQSSAFGGVSGTGRVIHETNKFILTGCTEGSQEKFQLFETFDIDLIYFFDRRPHVYNYSGILVNGDDTEFSFDPGSRDINATTFQWKNQFQRLYEEKLRGTRCVENGARVILVYEDVVREGYLLNFNISENAQNPLTIPFTFSLFITKESNNYKRSEQRVLTNDNAV